MSSTEFSVLVKRIYQELEEIQRVLTRTHDGWERARRSTDDLYLDGVALNLHGIYSGFERIFIQIAETVDDNLSKSENWHEMLLKQMMGEISGIRPAVISLTLRGTSRRFSQFRLVFRPTFGTVRNISYFS